MLACNKEGQTIEKFQIGDPQPSSKSQLQDGGQTSIPAFWPPTASLGGSRVPITFLPLQQATSFYHLKSPHRKTDLYTRCFGTITNFVYTDLHIFVTRGTQAKIYYHIHTKHPEYALSMLYNPFLSVHVTGTQEIMASN